MIFPANDTLLRQMVFIAMAPAIGLGIARFAYALLLPEMKSELQWSYSQAGLINTTNAAGYLIGALLTAQLAKHFTLWRLLQTGVIVSVIAVLLMGFTSDFLALNTLRLLAGISGALCFVAGGTIAAGLAAKSEKRSGFVLSLFYAGPGLGIVLTGISIPLFVTYFGNHRWTSAWLVAGSLAVVLAVFFFKAENTKNSSDTKAIRNLPQFSLVRNCPVLIGYFGFGAGYISYMTFMYAYLKNSGTSSFHLSLFWATIGAASMASPWAWGNLITRLKHGMAISFLTFVTLIGAVIPLLSYSPWMIYTSGAIFGIAFFSVPAATTAYARRNANTSQLPYVIGVFTVAFGSGQVFGPVMAGSISDKTAALSDGLWWGCVFLGFGLVIPLFQKDAALKAD